MPSLIPVVMPVILVWIIDTVRAVWIITNPIVATRVIVIGVVAIRIVAIWIGINISYLIPLRVGWNGTHRQGGKRKDAH
jgi:hypothetical protein